MNGNISKNFFSTVTGRFIQIIMGGWSVNGQLPDINKYVIIIAHHTSNWDFVVALGAKLVLGLKLRFFGKHTLFVGPLGAGLVYANAGRHSDRAQPVTQSCGAGY